MIVCTIAARNYLPQVRVLAASLRRRSPGQRFVVLLLDDLRRETTPEPDFEVLHAADLRGLAPRELARMGLIYDIVEMATALKPWTLEHLLAEDEVVVYLDPDIEVFSSLDFLGPLAQEHGLVLTPHVTRPVPDDGCAPTQLDLMASGVFNLGFITVGRSATPFLDYWKARLRRHCINDVPRQLFVDQRWVDFAAGFFPHHILRDETCNVAYWNADSREIGRDGDGYTVNGSPLTFFHYSGYEPEKPWLLSRHQRDVPRVLLSREPDLRALCDGYGAQLRAAGYGAETLIGYGYAGADGIAVDRVMRRLYRQALDAFEDGLAEEPPNPFLDGMSRFVAWLNQLAGAEQLAPVTRYLHALWEHRGDVRSVYWNLGDRRHVDEYLEWARTRGRLEMGIPDALLPPADETPRPGPLRPVEQIETGVNVVGYLRGVLGVGEAARALVSALDAAEEPHSTLVYERTLSRQDHAFRSRGAGDAPYDVNVLVLNADGTRDFALRVDPALFRDRYTIGMWAWETPELPAPMREGLTFVDEVWMGSDFARAAVARFTNKPVLTFPLPVMRPRPTPGLSRADLGLPEDRHVFLFCFDFFSVFERKNPLALVEAFRRAFAPGEGPVLAIKALNGEQRPVDRERLVMAVADRPDILLLEDCLPEGRRSALMALSDCYVSMHRSEGFGLTMAEAMALGKPVIATGFSGNLEYMTQENSFLVRHGLVPIGPGSPPYPPDHLWAEPDVDHCAELMRLVVRHPDEARRRGELAARDIAAKHSPEARAMFLVRRLHEIRLQRDPSGAGVGLVVPAMPAPEPIPLPQPLPRTQVGLLVQGMRQRISALGARLGREGAREAAAPQPGSHALDLRLRVLEERLEAVEDREVVAPPFLGNGNGHAANGHAANGNGNGHAANGNGHALPRVRKVADRD